MTITSPAPHHLLTRPDGRTIAIDEAGVPDGPVVLFLHSAPGSRRFDPDPEVTAAAGVRLVGFDRPGYGASSPLPEGTAPTVAALADDAAAVLDHLGVADAAVAGWSAGGRVGAGLAARHPGRVRSLAIVGTPSPADQSWIPPEHLAMLDGLRDDPGSATPALGAAFTPMVEADPADGLAFLVGPADDELLGDPGVRARVVAMLAEAFRPGPAGAAADVIADQITDWGFDPASVGAPTHTFSSEDDFIGPGHGAWWAETIPGGTAHVTSGVGHLLVISEWAAILDALGHPAG